MGGIGGTVIRIHYSPTENGQARLSTTDGVYKPNPFEEEGWEEEPPDADGPPTDEGSEEEGEGDTPSDSTEPTDNTQTHSGDEAIVYLIYDVNRGAHANLLYASKEVCRRMVECSYLVKSKLPSKRY
jgi:hypothetical protein